MSGEQLTGRQAAPRLYAGRTTTQAEAAPRLLLPAAQHNYTRQLSTTARKSLTRVTPRLLPTPLRSVPP